MPAPGSPQRLRYDAEGRQVRLTNYSGSGAETDVTPFLAEYFYDAEGRRVKRVANGTTTYYVHDAGGQLVTEIGGAGVVTGTQYLVADHLGSTRLVVNGSNGACAGRMDYAPFGGSIARDVGAWPCYEGLPVDQKFTGQVRDLESGLDYFGARYLGAGLGRFLSPDAPLVDQHVEDAGSWNLYAYVRNNPLSLVDPSGQRTQICLIEGGGCQNYSSSDFESLLKNPGYIFIGQYTGSGTIFERAANGTQGAQIGNWTYLGDDAILAIADRMGAVDSAVKIGAALATAPAWAWAGIVAAPELAALAATMGPQAWAQITAAAAAGPGALRRLSAWWQSLPRMDVAIGRGALPSSPFHVAFKPPNAPWMHGTGGQLGNMQIRTLDADIFAMQASKIMQIPIRNPAAVEALNGCRVNNCVHALGKAVAAAMSKP